MAALRASRLVWSAMPLMLLTMAPMTWDCWSSASMPCTASCMRVASSRITSTVCCTTPAPRVALASVPLEVSRAMLAASATAASRLTWSVITVANLTTL
ncbi:hypothetical protein D9M69_618420 [compost metagenome]